MHIFFWNIEAPIPLFRSHFYSIIDYYYANKRKALRILLESKTEGQEIAWNGVHFCIQQMLMISGICLEFYFLHTTNAKDFRRMFRIPSWCCKNLCLKIKTAICDEQSKVSTIWNLTWRFQEGVLLVYMLSWMIDLFLEEAKLVMSAGYSTVLLDHYMDI